MTQLFQKKYRIKSTRLKGWDYSQDSYYFVTICTKNKEEFFGKVRDKKMFLSPIGKIADKFWREIPQHFPFVKLDHFVVMPNHIHGVVIIDKWDYEEKSNNKSKDTKFCVSMNAKNKFGPQSKNLASIIRGFKVGVKKYATMNEINFAWQPRFYDHIISGDKEHGNIQDYILTNSANWEKDEENLKCEKCY